MAYQFTNWVITFLFTRRFVAYKFQNWISACNKPPWVLCASFNPPGYGVSIHKLVLAYWFPCRVMAFQISRVIMDQYTSRLAYQFTTWYISLYCRVMAYKFSNPVIIVYENGSWVMASAFAIHVLGWINAHCTIGVMANESILWYLRHLVQIFRK